MYRECILRCGEDNQHVHAGYAEETDPSLNVNDTDEDESKEFILHEPFHKPSSENIYLDVSESECNIVNKTLSQNSSSDVPTNIITELRYNEHIEPSVSDKGSSYFNIFKCSRNLLDQLDVTYQRAFKESAESSSVPKGYYGPYPAREIFYDIWATALRSSSSSIPSFFSTM